jgi:hypothetical protein
VGRADRLQRGATGDGAALLPLGEYRTSEGTLADLYSQVLVGTRSTGGSRTWRGGGQPIGWEHEAGYGGRYDLDFRG